MFFQCECIYYTYKIIIHMYVHCAACISMCIPGQAIKEASFKARVPRRFLCDVHATFSKNPKGCDFLRYRSLIMKAHVAEIIPDKVVLDLCIKVLPAQIHCTLLLEKCAQFFNLKFIPILSHRNTAHEKYVHYQRS